MSVSDRGRRRRRLDDEGEDEDAEKAPANVRPSECESEGEGADIELSEYESAVDESADPEDDTEEGSETETEEGSESEEETGSETETEGGEGYTDEEGLEEERQSGDGEEQPDNDKPDDDEDKKNPAYVPRKGAFYEHDFRQGEEVTEGEEGSDAQPKKKLWQDEGKWNHDRYIDEMQAPKTREELIAIYGYDIRAADKPPEAPPRRPGGRGKGPRKQRFQDFMPRMAVIDTTEDGLDTVPNLGDEELILYNEPSSRQGRHNNMRNNEGRRGGRGGNRGGGNFRGGDIEYQNNRNMSENSSRPAENRNKPAGRRNQGDYGSQDMQAGDDFPSLEESTRQMSIRDNRGEKRSENYERLKGDTRSGSERGQRSYQQDNRDNGRRGENREGNRGRFQQTQDIRRQDDVRGNNRHQQGYREDRRGGYNNRQREGNYNSRGSEENWRAAPSDFRDNFNKTDDYGGNSRGQQDYGYNRRQQQQYQGGDNRGPRIGNSGDAGGYSGPNRRGNRGYEQPPRYQQQQQQQQLAPEVTTATGREPREYTNSSYKAAEEKNRAKTGHNTATAPSNVGEGGDGSTSSSKNVVISNKENVQTINVTITSTTTEKKSYAKERRAKGASRPVEGAMVMEPQHPVTSVPVSHYQSLPPGGVNMDLNSAPPMTGAKRYSSQRQQGLAKGAFTEPPPSDGAGAQLYNPALPPPSFFQREPGAVAPSPHPTSSAPGGVQDSAHFAPALLPPAAALPFGLPGVPVSSSALALPPSAAGIPTNPAMFQAPTGPPPPTSIPAPGTALMAPPYLPAGMMYGGAPRVPPPGTPAAFPLSMAYTSPPPPTTVGAKVVGSQPLAQAATTQPGLQSAPQHKKVYRGDITYYAPELQQPSRTPQKRPKAAIPIIDPQEIQREEQKEKSEQRNAPEKSTLSSSYQTAPLSSTAGNNSHVGDTLAMSNLLSSSQESKLVKNTQHAAQSTVISGRHSIHGQGTGTQGPSPEGGGTKIVTVASPTTAVVPSVDVKPSVHPPAVSSPTKEAMNSLRNQSTSSERGEKGQTNSELLSGNARSQNISNTTGTQGKVGGEHSLPVATQSFKSDIVKAETAALTDVSKMDRTASIAGMVEVKQEVVEKLESSPATLTSSKQSAGDNVTQS